MLCAGRWISSNSADGKCLYSENKHRESKVDSTTQWFFQTLELMTLVAKLPCVFPKNYSVMDFNYMAETEKMQNNKGMQGGGRQKLLIWPTPHVTWTWRASITATWQKGKVQAHSWLGVRNLGGKDTDFHLLVFQQLF